MDVRQAQSCDATIIAEDSGDARRRVDGRRQADRRPIWSTQRRRSASTTSTASSLRKVELPGIGTASGFGGDLRRSETFFSFTSFNRPTTIYRYDVASGEATVWAAPKLAFNPDDYCVEQRFYASKDGTRVPMFIVRKKGVTGPAPTSFTAMAGSTSR